MTQFSARLDDEVPDPAAMPLVAAMPGLLAELAAAPDHRTQAVAQQVLDRLGALIGARTVCLFSVASGSSPVLQLRGSPALGAPDLMLYHLAAEQALRPRPQAARTDTIETLVMGVSDNNGSEHLVLTFSPTLRAVDLDDALHPMVSACLRAIHGCLLRARDQVRSDPDFGAVVAAMDFGIATYDPTGRMLFSNSAFRRLCADRLGEMSDLPPALALIGFPAPGTACAAGVPELAMAHTLTLPGGVMLEFRLHSLPDDRSVLVCQDIAVLHQEMGRWRSAIEGAGVGIWEVTIADGQNHINDRWAEMLGYDRAELGTQTLDTFYSLLSPDSVAANKAAYDRVLARQSDSFECELEMYHKNGHSIWVLSRGRVTQFDVNGNPAILSGVHLEVTEMKLAEERLKQVVEGAQIGTWDWDIALEVQRTNDQWAKMLGYSAAEVSPMTYEVWRKFVHPEDIDRVEASMALCLRGEVDAMSLEYRMLHKNGEWRWMIDRAKVIAQTRDGKAAYIAGVQIEISEQKAREVALLAAKTEAEKALAERNRAEQRFADIAAVSDDWLWEQDRDLRFGFLSHTQFLNILPPAHTTLLGQSWQRWVQNCPDGLVKADWAALAATTDARAPFRDFVIELTPDRNADPRWLRISGTPVFAESGEFLGYRGIGSDITQLYLAKSRAELASKSKSLFLANMSHEIRTPLNGVLGMAEVLEAAVTEPRQREMIRMIRDSGESLLNILNDILDMSKIEARKMTLESVVFDPTELATRIEDLHRLRAEEKGLNFEISLGLGAEQPRIGDPHRLRQILNNLVSNAIKFTEQGEVNVVLRGKPGKPLSIEINDTGIGMSSEQIAHIHEEFVQADSSITRRYGGTGLGMSITRTLVDMMSGRMSIVSELGRGTRIVVELPLPNAQDTPLHSTPRAEEQVKAKVAAGLHCLIADDNATNCTVLRHLLHQLGAKTTVVTNGLEALNMWKKQPFDLLLIDIAMPVMDGKTAVQNIRKAELETQRPYTKAVAVTANLMPYQIEEYIGAGFDATIGKPVSTKALARTVLDLMSTR